MSYEPATASVLRVLNCPHIVVSAEPSPECLVVYHGTDVDLVKNRPTTHDWGMFFTDDKDVADAYGDKKGGATYKATVCLNHPFKLSAAGQPWDEIEYTNEVHELVAKSGRQFDPYEVDTGDGEVLRCIDIDTLVSVARNAGYDGLIVTDLVCAVSDSYSEIVAFHDSQIQIDGVATASTDYQDDTEYNDKNQELMRLGLIFGQPRATEHGIKVSYKDHEIEIRSVQDDEVVVPAKPAVRGRKYQPATYKKVPVIFVIGRSGSNRLAPEKAEHWLRGLKAFWDKE